MPLTNGGPNPAVLAPGTPEGDMYVANKERFRVTRETQPVRIAVYAPAKNEEHNVKAGPRAPRTPTRSCSWTPAPLMPPWTGR